MTLNSTKYAIMFLSVQPYTSSLLKAPVKEAFARPHPLWKGGVGWASLGRRGGLAARFFNRGGKDAVVGTQHAVEPSMQPRGMLPRATQCHMPMHVNIELTN